ncbi:AraC family transcriptional regulator [Paenibacillus xerothermodurans]|uniref:AraC family transcriptional regulator n=1 Tax=Paenibacillus xerothermodurans TaxID=1977292 RepID=A0A2W1N9H1_PAEXE|nr:AraC family transcriptional regulator [Paenibacillus xerothermodurans]PZE21289.1 AraC family transcriptional regulator [Paenibacillus xerothermodurans]
MSSLRQMLRFQGFKRKSVFVKLLASNVFILLMPMIIGVVLYAKVEQFITDNVKRYNLGMLEQLKQSMDARLKEVEQLAQQISLNPKLNGLLGDGGSQLNSDYKYIEFARHYLERHKLMTSDFIYDYYLYFAGTDTILKQGVKTDSRTFYKYYYQYAHLSYTDWMENILNGYHSTTYLPSSELMRRPGLPVAASSLPGNPSGRVITYVQSLPIGSSTEARGTLVVLIEEAKITEMIRQIESVNQSSVLIVNNSGEIIMGNSKPVVRRLSVLQNLASTSGLIDGNVIGKDLMMSYISSDRTDWKYVTITPTGVFLQHVDKVKEAALWLFLCCLAGGAAAAYFTAYRNYAPLRLIIKGITKGGTPAQQPSNNEYELLQETIQESLAEGHNLRQIIHRQMPVLQANFLTRLIRGQVDDSTDTGDAAQFLNIRFVSDSFAVILVDIDDTTGFVARPSERQWATIRFILTNVMTELAQQYHSVYSVALDRDRLALLLNLHDNRSTEAWEDVKAAAVRLKEWIEIYYRIIISVSVSDIHQGVTEIRTCYAEAVQAADYKIVRDPGEILYYRDIRQDEQGFDYPIETEIQLMNLVKSGDFTQVEVILERIYQTNFLSKRLSPDIGRCLFFNITGTLLKILNSSLIRNTDQMQRMFDSIKHILAAKTAESMHLKTKGIFRMLTEAIREERTDHGQQLLEKVRGLVENNLTNPNMGLALLAEQLNMSPQYLSTFFKKAQGENLTDFILKKRVEYAKQLMEDKTLTNTRVAQLVGYSNDIVFIRAFKKMEGITPGKYRESL